MCRISRSRLRGVRSVGVPVLGMVLFAGAYSSVGTGCSGRRFGGEQSPDVAVVTEPSDAPKPLMPAPSGLETRPAGETSSSLEADAGDETATAGTDETATAGNDETATAGTDETATAGNDETATAGNDETATAGTVTVTDPESSDCTTKVQVSETFGIGFEDLSAAPLQLGPFPIASDGEIVSAAFTEYADGTGGYALEWVAGAEGSAMAVSASNPRAEMWGGGVALLLSCLDASEFQGVEFWLRGETPAGAISFRIDHGVDNRSATTDLTLPPQWTRYQVSFSSFTGAPGDTPVDSSGIRALMWSSHLNFVERPRGSDQWVAEPGAFELAVDEIRFY